MISISSNFVFFALRFVPERRHVVTTARHIFLFWSLGCGTALKDSGCSSAKLTLFVLLVLRHMPKMKLVAFATRLFWRQVAQLRQMFLRHLQTMVGRIGWTLAIGISSHVFGIWHRFHSGAVFFRKNQCVVCRTRFGQNAHYICACFDRLCCEERAHVKSLRRKEHVERWEATRARKTAQLAKLSQESFTCRSAQRSIQ